MDNNTTEGDLVTYGTQLQSFSGKTRLSELIPVVVLVYLEVCWVDSM